MGDGMDEVFELEEVAKLRRRAREARSTPDEGPEGWSRSEIDPHDLLAVFEPLRVKSGFALRAYLFRSGGTATASSGPSQMTLPSANPRSPPEDSFSPVPGVVLSSPRPSEALDDLMEAIEGNGSPWSYLCASLFAREATEFGALWHGVSWDETAIVGGDPFGGGPVEVGTAGGFSARPESWTWHAEAPREWRPAVSQREEGPEVIFHTYSAVMPETLRRHHDRYGPLGYRFSEEGEDLASGPGGIIF